MYHLYGVMEDIEGPDTAEDDVRGLVSQTFSVSQSDFFS